ncbi:hypothetical protein DPMN_019213 [Dreissena polymorpha]|uniref:Uncharacterized protein n=1 Tax=Dreissena polymorpha TaxID=45954 RepID=A0A9D4NEL8_DREPO|nr:hypothetical protein DPMN_162312 [Dreissena polymorpha]KAH3879847.1 hypothetical protein DPMN_003754 [Dreissena polymorpha]KAH3895053.1 hypothetical protein DPMN_019213 [Dreissena polymorpha]
MRNLVSWDYASNRLAYTPVHCSIVTVYNFGQGLVGGGETCRTPTLCTPLGASLRSSSSINRYRGVTPASSHSTQT